LVKIAQTIVIPPPYILYYK